LLIIDFHLLVFHLNTMIV